MSLSMGQSSNMSASIQPIKRREFEQTLEGYCMFVMSLWAVNDL